MCLSVMVRARATLGFMMVQAENPMRRIGSRARSHDILQGCEDEPHRQEGTGGWGGHVDTPEAGYSIQVRWVGE